MSNSSHPFYPQSHPQMQQSATQFPSLPSNSWQSQQFSSFPQNDANQFTSYPQSQISLQHTSPMNTFQQGGPTPPQHPMFPSPESGGAATNEHEMALRLQRENAALQMQLRNMQPQQQDQQFYRQSRDDQAHFHNSNTPGSHNVQHRPGSVESNLPQQNSLYPLPHMVEGMDLDSVLQGMRFPPPGIEDNPWLTSRGSERQLVPLRQSSMQTIPAGAGSSSQSSRPSTTTTTPATTNPATTKPATTNPASTKPATTNPASTNPATTNPASTNPASTNPASTNPAKKGVSKSIPTLDLRLTVAKNTDLAPNGKKRKKTTHSSAERGSKSNAARRNAKHSESESSTDGGMASSSDDGDGDDDGDDGEGEDDEEGLVTPTGGEFPHTADDPQETGKGKSKKGKKNLAALPIPPIQPPPPIDPRIVDGIGVISGSYKTLIVQYQELRKDLHNVSQLTLQNQTLIGTLVGGGAPNKSGDVYQFTQKEMDDLVNSNLLRNALSRFNLHVNHGKVLAAAVNAFLLGLLHLKGFSPQDMKSFVGPSQAQIAAFESDAPGKINFDIKSQFTYGFDLPKSHPLNDAARASFFFHFERSQRNQHWLHAKIFDKRLITLDIVKEVLDRRLKSIKQAWSKRLKEKKVLTLAQKHKKRVYQRVLGIILRRERALTRSDMAVLRAFFKDLSKAIHSDDESGNEGVAILKKGPRMKTVRALPHWRSAKLSFLLWWLDAIDEEFSMSIIESTNASPGQGRPRRVRHFPTSLQIVHKHKIPRSLPVNCYSKAFLKSLSKWELVNLDPQPPQAFGDDERVTEFVTNLLRHQPQLDALMKGQAEGTADEMP
ncbi:hypothetical protein SCHPADRAFT_896247 [Schizopora paradoxa]|uniref:Uncharacterized protein n=1 Tax=Schizopora paradoxa TaxID=27342 RepID=A0A0H2RKX3_9AGAM|nr:hypothetical protein SCHPADRAFT_896247 [Schizopora paradoxa]